MKKTILILNIALIGLLSACSVGGPLIATEGAVGSKTGESSYKVILGLFITNKGDASIKKAAANGGITKVATVDQKMKGGFFSVTYSTIVTGE